MELSFRLNNTVLLGKDRSGDIFSLFFSENASLLIIRADGGMRGEGRTHAHRGKPLEEMRQLRCLPLVRFILPVQHFKCAEMKRSCVCQAQMGHFAG